MTAGMDAALALAETAPSEFTLQYPPRREYFQEYYRAKPDWRRLVAGCGDELLLYVHVPFCRSKCSYCNFAVDVRPDAKVHRAYVDRLVAQVESLLEWADGKTLRGIDMGGGTPTLLGADQLNRVMDALKPWLRRAVGPRPMSVETTPEAAANHPERLWALAAGGARRLSMGLQSAVSSEAAEIGRRPQVHLVERAAREIAEAGFERFNVDLIFGLPNQGEPEWRESLNCAVSLKPTSITTYDCLYRGKGRRMSKRSPHRPTAEHYGRLYDVAHAFLGEAGYHAPYGSLNFSRFVGETGTSAYFEARLLDGLPYLGAGNYASSMIGHAWGFAPHGVAAWQHAIDCGDALPTRDAYALPVPELMAKHLLLSLNFGVIDAERFEKRFGEPIEPRFGPALRHAEEKGWLVRNAERWSIAPGAFKELPKIRALVYPLEAIAWLGQIARADTAPKTFASCPTC